MVRRTARVTAEPLETDAVPVVTIGTLLWGVAAFLLALFARGWLSRHDRMWWLWTCVAGFGLGLVGIWYVRRRRARLGRRAAARGD